MISPNKLIKNPFSKFGNNFSKLRRTKSLAQKEPSPAVIFQPSPTVYRKGIYETLTVDVHHNCISFCMLIVHLASHLQIIMIIACVKMTLGSCNFSLLPASESTSERSESSCSGTGGGVGAAAGGSCSTLPLSSSPTTSTSTQQSASYGSRLRKLGFPNLGKVIKYT